MQPTDLFDIDTAKFSASLPKHKFTNRPELVAAAKEYIQPVDRDETEVLPSPARVTKLD
jgi:hypothetical protein